MVHKLIELSLRNRFAVLIIAVALLVWGIFAVRKNPMDAIPDLSENEVIVFTEWTGQSPQIVNSANNPQPATNARKIQRRSRAVPANSQSTHTTMNS